MKSLEEALEWTAASLDQQIKEAIEHDELLLSDLGATDDEIAAHVAKRREEAVIWRASCLAEVRRGLSDWDAPSSALQ
ncbi:hypothetical protein [Rhizobium sp. L43]|uniref:hypothetical protein n=1 Tax=Rhizobium sp. L43 TaxID=2035452 RepID=UPI000BE98EFE|nr:hypothetical protein [Rhizobium sp. L43]PDS80140.1 hypothetical protein CO667_06500 [Rhizobium sp. L43]